MIKVNIGVRLHAMLVGLDEGGSGSVRRIVIAVIFGVLGAAAHGQAPADPAARVDQGGLSEAMIATQHGHTKLWFAGKLGNWPLAAYELDQIASPLDWAARRYPDSQQEVARQVSAVRAAIEAKDVAGFSKAYAELTTGCNACHRAAGRAFINMQVPATSPFADQDFADRAIEGRTLANTICGICHVVPDKANTPLALGFSAPGFAELARRPSLTEASLRQLLVSRHRRVGPEQAMPNPRLNDNQIEDIVAYFAGLKAGQPH